MASNSAMLSAAADAQRALDEMRGTMGTAPLPRPRTLAETLGDADDFFRGATDRLRVAAEPEPDHEPPPELAHTVCPFCEAAVHGRWSEHVLSCTGEVKPARFEHRYRKRPSPPPPPAGSPLGPMIVVKG
jgi:hypothetical protein